MNIGRLVSSGAAVSLLLAAVVFDSTAVAQGTRLNNLVTELVSLDSAAVAELGRVEFVNPRAGWVYFECAPLERGQSGPHVTLDEAVGTFFPVPARRGDAAEAMRFLSEGVHTLAMTSPSPSQRVGLVIRTMPETHFVRYPQQPRYPELGDFSFEWLDQNVLSSVNTLVGIPGEELDKIADSWTSRGRKLIAYGGLPHEADTTGDKAFAHWNGNVGFQDPRFGGMIADEFQGRQNPLYPAWIEGMRRLGEAQRETGRAFYAYCGGPGMYSRPEAKALVRTVFDAGFYMAWERYHHEMPTLPEAEHFMDELLGDEMARWQAVFPDCQKQMVLVLGIFATGPDLDVEPGVNYKVWMDMQMRYLATHPRFKGLFGIHWWYSGAASEDLLRWESALYRHYCIEGQTTLLSEPLGWTYELPHIANPDFVDDFAGWTAMPAAEGAMRTGYLERYAGVQNRYWHRGGIPDHPAGNTYAWMKRSAERPNELRQTIRGLTPGKVYTVQLISADYPDIVHGRSEEKVHGIAMMVKGAERIDALSYADIKTTSSWSHPQLPFDNRPARFNHHRVAFRAKGESAELTISDWRSGREAGGEVGKELTINYVQVQPYFE